MVTSNEATKLRWQQLQKTHKVKRSALILGIDEVGWGSWAGPLTVCGVLAASDWWHPGLRDSKELTPLARSRVSGELFTRGVSFYIAMATSTRMDTGPGNTLRDLRREVLEHFGNEPDLAVIDGDNTSVYFGTARGSSPDHKYRSPTKVIHAIDADVYVPVVSAASVIAKVSRDRYMSEYAHACYPNYAFDKHKGYICKAHKEAVRQYGLTVEHRRCYKVRL